MTEEGFLSYCQATIRRNSPKSGFGKVGQGRVLGPV